MNRADFLAHFKSRLLELYAITEKAHQEYADVNNAFDNFDRLAVDLNIDRKKILWVYAKKHLDGIRTYLNDPTRASREPISGRISDVIVYMILLDAMIVDEMKSLVGNYEIKPRSFQ